MVEVARDDPHHRPPGVWRRAARRMPTGSCSVMSRPVRSKQSSARAAARSSLGPGLGEHPAVAAGHHRGAAEEAGQALAEVLEATAGQHDADEDLVGLVHALEDAGLLVEHGPEDLGDHALGACAVGGARSERAARPPRAGLRQRWPARRGCRRRRPGRRRRRRRARRRVAPAASARPRGLRRRRRRGGGDGSAARDPSSEARVTHAVQLPAAVDQPRRRRGGQRRGAPRGVTPADDVAQHAGAEPADGNSAPTGRHHWQHSP